MVPVNQDALNSQVLDACKREEREYQRFATDLEGNVHQDVIEVASLAKSTVKNAVTQLKKKYPTTHCRQMVSDESGQVIIISQMKEELEAAKQYFAKSAGIKAWRNVQAFTVDRDIFEYIQEFFPDRFNKIKSEYGAEWHLKEMDDEIQIQARQKDDGKSGKQFSPDGSNFKTAIMDVIDKIQQESEYFHSGF
uniref:Uncharacterized protein n=1 Tax=Ciona savignyi TaxID=51511 RepID=H2Z3D5_CIOSA